MKHLFITASLTLFSISAFATQHVQCDIKITENTVKCPLGVGLFCKQKDLRESQILLSKEISDGQVIEDNLPLNKVVLFPGTSKQDKNSIYLLQGDERATKLHEEKELDLVEFQTKESIRYNISKSGNTTNIEFSNGNSKYRFAISGEYSGKVHGWIHVNVSDVNGDRKLLPILLSCHQISSSIVNESELQKNAVDDYLNKKEKASASIQ